MRGRGCRTEADWEWACREEDVEEEEEVVECGGIGERAARLPTGEGDGDGLLSREMEESLSSACHIDLLI